MKVLYIKTTGRTIKFEEDHNNGSHKCNFSQCKKKALYRKADIFQTDFFQALF